MHPTDRARNSVANTNAHFRKYNTQMDKLSRRSAHKQAFPSPETQ